MFIFSPEFSGLKFYFFEVFDILGKEVITVNQKQNLGNYSVSFKGSNLLSGIYFIR
ncbi:MAG: T9SS type A sorting domain-containing protein [Bacteroidota bacterium]|nr:T9SS type A sorting domain-containing protein [Bacteroidota bacterium]